jgi:hyperosmotically inducible periplasmic protein
MKGDTMRSITARSFKNPAILLVLFILILGTAASSFAGTSQQAPARDSAAYETWLTKQVRHELVMIPWYSVFDNLQYKVEGGKVTLLGQVTQPTIKDEAASAVKHIEGVESVDNQIQVLPVSFNDDRIRRATFRAIYSFPSLQMYALRSVPTIHIIVDNGHITLEGSVSRESDKDAAGIRANAVPGAFSVTNNLRVDNS